MSDLLWKRDAITVTGHTAVLRALVRDSEGRPLCRWCGKVVVSPRRAWCSDACVKEYKEVDSMFSGGGRRDHLLKLEGGVCQTCGLDTERLQRRMRRAYRLVMFFERVPRQGRNTPPYLHNRKRAMVLVGRLVERRIGRDPGALNLDRTWWEADHIVPLIESGDHSPENLRTLCIWCHRDETAALAGRRAGTR